MRFLGIDPGVAGGLAVITEFGEIVEVIKMPDTREEILRFMVRHEEAAIKASVNPADTIRGALEYVRSRPGLASPGMWKFATNYGHLEMALTASNIPYYDVHPARWQKLLDCRTGGDKNISKARAVALWPGIKITHAIADALLIAEWCRRKTIIVNERAQG